MKATKCQKFPIKCERVRLRGWGLYTWQMMIRSDDPFMLIHHRRCSLLFRFFHIFHPLFSAFPPTISTPPQPTFLVTHAKRFFFSVFRGNINSNQSANERHCQELLEWWKCIKNISSFAWINPLYVVGWKGNANGNGIYKGWRISNG